MRNSGIHQLMFQLIVSQKGPNATNPSISIVGGGEGEEAATVALVGSRRQALVRGNSSSEA
jgi:hypothetical protein